MKTLAATLLLAIAPVSSNAKFVDYQTLEVEFRYRLFEDRYPMLEFGFSQLHGNMQYVEAGLGFLSCWPGRIDLFRLNFLLTTPIVAQLAESRSAFVLLHSQEWPGGGVVGSRPSDEYEELPSEFEAFAKERVGLEVVREFGPLEVSDRDKLFVSSVPDAAFVQGLAVKDTLSLAYYQNSDRRFRELFRIKLGMHDEVLKRFLASCVTAN